MPACARAFRSAAPISGKNLSIIETNAGGDVGKEASFIDRLVSAGVQAIVLSAVSPDGSVRAIKRAHEAGIPVVCYNTCINEADMKQYVYAYAVGDPFTFGYKIGQVAADDFVKAGKTEPKIGVLNCEFVDVCVQRRLGFEKALGEKVPGFKIVANQEATILDKAISTGEKIITANPEIDALWGESGGAALGRGQGDPQFRQDRQDLCLRVGHDDRDRPGNRRRRRDARHRGRLGPGAWQACAHAGGQCHRRQEGRWRRSCPTRSISTPMLIRPRPGWRPTPTVCREACRARPTPDRTRAAQQFRRG